MPQLEQSEALLIASNCFPGSTSDDFIASIKIYFRSISDSKFRNFCGYAFCAFMAYEEFEDSSLPW